MADDGEFRFPPNLNPTTFGELKFITLWELWGEPPIHEVFSDARHLQRDDRDACAERVVCELLSEGYAELVRGRSDAPQVRLAPSEAHEAVEALRAFDRWLADGTQVRLAPTPKWWEWAEVEKGVKPDP